MPPKLETDPKKFVRWFSIEGFVAVIVILVAVIQSVLTLLGVIPVDTEKLITTNIAILSILTTISVASLIRLANQAKAIIDLTEQNKRKDLATYVIRRRQDRPNLEELTRGAKRVVICDAFLSSIQIEHHLLVTLLQSRCDIFIVVLDPNNENLLEKMAELSSLEPLENLRYVLQAAINNILSVSKQHSKGNNEVVNGSLHLKSFSSFMPFGGILIEGVNANESKVLIELHPYKYDELKIHRHHFYLEKRNTPELFETYKEAIEQINTASKQLNELPKAG